MLQLVIFQVKSTSIQFKIFYSSLKGNSRYSLPVKQTVQGYTVQKSNDKTNLKGRCDCWGSSEYCYIACWFILFIYFFMQLFSYIVSLKGSEARGKMTKEIENSAIFDESLTRSRQLRKRGTFFKRHLSFERSQAVQMLVRRSTFIELKHQNCLY